MQATMAVEPQAPASRSTTSVAARRPSPRPPTSRALTRPSRPVRPRASSAARGKVPARSTSTAAGSTTADSVGARSSRYEVAIELLLRGEARPSWGPAPPGGRPARSPAASRPGACHRVVAVAPYDVLKSLCAGARHGRERADLPVPGGPPARWKERDVTGVRLVEAAQAPLLAMFYYAGGAPGPITAALANVPELLDVAMPFLATVLGASAVDARTKELVILRTSAVLGCRYCVQTHTTAASDAGLSRTAVAAWAEAVAAAPGPVAGAPRAALRAHFGDHHVVELTMLAGATIMLNRFCTALELPTPPDVVARLAEEGWA